MQYLLHEISFTHTDSTWLDRYWSDPSARLTYLLRSGFDNSFWEKYSRSLQARIDFGALVFRAKWQQTPFCLKLTQMWTSEDAMTSFKREVDISDKVSSLLSQQGIETKENTEWIEIESARNIVHNIFEQKYILQALNDSLQINAPKTIEDPLKNKLVTPFQSSQQARDQDVLFSSLYLPPFPKEAVLNKILKVEKSHWHWDDYRQVEMLPLMTSNGSSSRNSVNAQNATATYQWTEDAPLELRSYFDQYIWDWVKPQSRVMILKTKPGARNQEHIDCSPDQFEKLQLKLRIVLQGRTDSLYFITKGEPIFAPVTDGAYLIDGSWPHGMINNFSDDKYTLCIGAPWTGSQFYPAFSSVIYRDRNLLPDNFSSYFDKKYSNRPLSY